MRGEKLHQAVRRLVCVVGSQGGGDLTDGQLLERFSAYRDEVAFAALVRRHAPLVLGVCRRLLRDPHDADDAFQATFLVLVRKLGTLDHRRPIGNWLYGVAYRVALKARARRAAGVNRLMTRSVSIAPSTSEQTDDSPHPDIRPILDEELNRLPKKYRIALVMCYLQGKTHAQAAKELAWPTGSMSKRLAKGKELLRERLTRRGVALSSAALGTGFAESAAAAGSGSALIVSTTEAAVAYAAGKYTAAAVSASAAILAKGALNAMWMTKVKTIAAAILAGVVLSGGTGVAAYRVWANGEATDKKGPALLPAAKAAEQPVNTAAETLQNAETDEDKVQGTWTVVWAESGSPEPREREAQEKRLQNTKVIFAGDELEFRHVDPKQRAIGDRARFRLAPFTSPRTIAITPIDKPGELSLHGIYAWQGDAMKICLVDGTHQMPKEFVANVGTSNHLLFLKREIKQGRKDVTVKSSQPVVVKTVPQAGDTEVDAEKTTEIRVTFSKDMADKSWSWSQISKDTFPEIIGKPYYEKDQRTCVIKVKLQPAKTYVLWLNPPKFQGFRDADGHAAVFYPLVFETKP